MAARLNGLEPYRHPVAASPAAPGPSLRCTRTEASPPSLSAAGIWSVCFPTFPAPALPRPWPRPSPPWRPSCILDGVMLRLSLLRSRPSPPCLCFLVDVLWCLAWTGIPANNPFRTEPARRPTGLNSLSIERRKRGKERGFPTKGTTNQQQKTLLLAFCAFESGRGFGRRVLFVESACWPNRRRHRDTTRA